MDRAYDDGVGDVDTDGDVGEEGQVVVAPMHGQHDTLGLNEHSFQIAIIAETGQRSLLRHAWWS